MWLAKFSFILNFIIFCRASYHEQYRGKLSYSATRLLWHVIGKCHLHLILVALYLGASFQLYLVRAEAIVTSLVPKTCTDKWESYILDEKEYIIQNLPVKWESARILCRGHHNGTLAVIDTLEKAEFLAEALSESQLDIESVWVGARRPGDSSSGYRWLSGAPLRRTASDVMVGEEAGRSYPSWLNRTAVPVPAGGADCVALDRVNHDRPVLLDLPCLIERGFVCEREAQQVSVVSEISLVRCKTGLYRVYSGKLTWDQAAAYCVMKKMSLANIETMRCLKKLGMTMLKTRPSIENAWVGARGELGQWSWVDTGASIFAPSLFSDASAELWPPMRDRTTIKQNGCLQLDRHATHPPVFLEARCERKMQFICYESSKMAMRAQITSTAPPSDDNYYYILVRKALFWQHAHDNCLKMNGTLAKIENNEILIELLLLMGENTEAPVDHVWISGRLNMTKDTASETVSYFWFNPVSSRRIPDPKSLGTSDAYMLPWLDEEPTMDNSCLNLDRQNHLTALVYGLPCDTAQYSVCMIEKSLLNTVGVVVPESSTYEEASA